MPFTFSPPLWLDETPSTNDVLKSRVASGEIAASGAVVAARRQTEGRGRMGNVWLSSAEGDLTFSFYWRSNRSGGSLDFGALPMACSLGVRDFLVQPPWRLDARCKWPNDVLVRDAKICGILTEGGVGPSGLYGLVVGIGVNLRRVPGRDDGIGRATAALEDAGLPLPGQEALLDSLLPCLEKRVAMWETGGFAAIRDDMTNCLWGIGKETTARTPGGKAHGVIAGLGENGELALLAPNGQMTIIASVSALEEGW